MIIALICQHPVGFWLSLGGLLLIAELLGAGGYLLWTGVAALLVGGGRAIFPLSWSEQAIGFAIITGLTALLWWRWVNQQQTRSSDPLLNQRDRQFIGLQTILESPIVNGKGRLQINDGSWQIYCQQDLPPGTRVEIVDIKGITLIVKAI